MSEAIDPRMDDNIKTDNLMENINLSTDGTIRENLISTAIHFLLNPRVINTRLTEKREFLMKKGLNSEEIDLAIDRAHAFSLQTQTSAKNGFVSPLMPTQPIASFWIRSANFMSSIATISGLIYGTYVLYKRFLEPYLFPKTQSQKHPYVIIQEQLTQLTAAISSLQSSVSTFETYVKQQIENELLSSKSSRDVTLYDLKTELNSIKALLVNRRSFATPAASIPLWQLNDDYTPQNKSLPNETQMKTDEEYESSHELINGDKELLNGDNELLNGDNELLNGDNELLNGDNELQNGNNDINSTK